MEPYVFIALTAPCMMFVLITTVLDGNRDAEAARKKYRRLLDLELEMCRVQSEFALLREGVL